MAGKTDSSTSSTRVIIANRNVRIGGRDYAPGELIDTSNLSDSKVGQLLNLRLLRPGHPSDVHMGTGESK